MGRAADPAGLAQRRPMAGGDQSGRSGSFSQSRLGLLSLPLLLLPFQEKTTSRPKWSLWSAAAGLQPPPGSLLPTVQPIQLRGDPAHSGAHARPRPAAHRAHQPAAPLSIRFRTNYRTARTHPYSTPGSRNRYPSSTGEPSYNTNFAQPAAPPQPAYSFTNSSSYLSSEYSDILGIP